MKKIFLAIFIIFFTGCSTKVSQVFQKDNKYITLTQYTKRAQMVKSLETIALINATYLNPILGENNETKNNEIFIIGVYNSNDYKGYEKGGLFNPNYHLTLNDQNFTKAIKADKIKLNLADYPFYNKWMKYYKVYFPETNSSTLTIKYTNTEMNTSVNLNIPKHIYIQ